jgi:hypothetical protein
VAVGQHHIGLEQVVHRQAAFARQVPEPTTERESADPGRADDAARRGHAERMRGVIHVAPGAATVDPYGTRCGIDPNALQPRQVEHQPFVADAQAATVVPAATHRQQQRLLTGEVDAVHHVGDVAAVDDEPRVGVDHRVVDPARIVVVGVTGLHDPAAQRGGKLGNLLRAEHGVSPVRGTSC